MKSYCTDRSEFMEMIQETWKQYPMDSLDGIWGCLYNNCRSSMACDGGNQYKLAHNGGRKRAENTGTSVYRKVNVDDYNRIKNKLSL